MSTVENLVGSVRDALVRTGRSLLVQDADFGSSLTVGQVLKGRVMRHYEGGRYQVELGGQPRVVDSTTSLRVGEVLTARVMGLGEQVHLQRLRADAEGAAEMAASTAASTQPSGRNAQLQALLEQYQVELPARDLAALQRAVRRAGQPDLMTLSGLVLSKIGAGLRPELLQALYGRLGPSLPSGLPPFADAAQLAVGRGAGGAWEPAGEALAAELQRLAELAGEASADGEAAEVDGDSAGGETSGSGDENEERWALGQWLLNVQSHGRIAHRIVTLPLWVGDRLVEVSVALFSEARDGSDAAGITFRRAVLSLDLEHLGRVQITLNGAERDLRVAVAGEREESVAQLARFAAELEHSLQSLSWRVSELDYLQARIGAEGEVLDTVVQHHITQDSLSRWM